MCINSKTQNITSLQKQPYKGVLKKRCCENENMQQIYRTPMLKCDFNKVVKQIALRQVRPALNFRLLLIRQSILWEKLGNHDTKDPFCHSFGKKNYDDLKVSCTVFLKLHTDITTWNGCQLIYPFWSLFFKKRKILGRMPCFNWRLVWTEQKNHLFFFKC